jgi:hypothetical protein
VIREETKSSNLSVTLVNLNYKLSSIELSYLVFEFEQLILSLD